MSIGTPGTPGNEQTRRYRERAEELRVIAQTFKDDTNRLTLQKLAFDYERMADVLESNPTSQKPRRRA